jgi:hypothetical protein
VGFTLVVMSMTITVPDRTAHRLQRAAARRGVSVEVLAVETLDALDDAPLPSAADDVDPLEAFIGCGSSGGARPFEIHEARRELAARRAAEGIENL